MKVLRLLPEIRFNFWFSTARGMIFIQVVHPGPKHIIRDVLSSVEVRDVFEPIRFLLVVTVFERMSYLPAAIAEGRNARIREV